MYQNKENQKKNQNQKDSDFNVTAKDRKENQKENQQSAVRRDEKADSKQNQQNKKAS